MYNLLKDTPGAIVDVGANVGFVVNLGLALKRRVYAIEPIQYNVAKICETFRSSHFDLQRENHLLELYKVVAGRAFKEDRAVTRPADKVGYFEQSSLSRINVQQIEVEEEHVPMVDVDSILLYQNEDECEVAREPIAMIKIDVQGHEYGVLAGMHRTLSKAKEVGFPKYILYEADQTMLSNSGHSPQTTMELVQSYGYSCMYASRHGKEILCVLGEPPFPDAEGEEQDPMVKIFGPEIK